MAHNHGGVGSWRLKSNGQPWPGLPAAIAAVEAAHIDRPDLRALAHFLIPRMPGKPLASNTLKTTEARSDWLPLNDVVTSHAWIGMNTPTSVNVLWVESDRDDFDILLDRAIAAGLPCPTWRARGERGGHAAWVLETPVSSREDSPERNRRMSRLLSKTHSYLCTAVQADRSAALRGMTKNPWHPRWDVTVGGLITHELKSILEPLVALGDTENWPIPKRIYSASTEGDDSDGMGRNSTLFGMVRRHAYQEHHEGRSVTATALLPFAEKANADFGIPLPKPEIVNIVSSVSRWMSKHYRSNKNKAKRKRLSPGMVYTRRADAGRLTGQKRASSRDDCVGAAMDTLRAQGVPVSQTAIADITGYHPRTVRRALPWKAFKNKRGGEDGEGSISSGGDSDNIEPNGAVSESGQTPTALSGCSEKTQAGEGKIPCSQVQEHESAKVHESAGRLPVWSDFGGARRADRVALQANLAAFEALTSLDFIAGIHIFLKNPSNRKWLQNRAMKEDLADPNSSLSIARRKRRRSQENCRQREEWHRTESAHGSGSYREAVRTRFRGLFKQRADELAKLQMTWPDPEDCLAYMARAEQGDKIKLVRMGWSAMLKAEERIVSRWEDTFTSARGRAGGTAFAATGS